MDLAKSDDVVEERGRVSEFYIGDEIPKIPLTLLMNE